MNNRLKAWIGFNDGKCDDDTQMLIDDIKELENKLTDQQKKIDELEKKLDATFDYIEKIESLISDDKARGE